MQRRIYAERKVSRSTRERRSESATTSAVPTKPASDTSAARDLLSRIDELTAD